MSTKNAEWDSSLAQQIHKAITGMSRSERKIARILHATLFRAGLESIASLASQANVSGPTVIRFTSKLGFLTYRDFQEAARRQYAESVKSPATLYERAAVRRPKASLSTVVSSIAECIQSTFDMIAPDEFEKIVRILGDKHRNICTIGGQASGVFADHLAARLYQLRPAVRSVGAQPVGFSQEAQLPFMGRRDVVVAFDFRRYQKSTVFFSNTAAAQGATVILITDPWLSPIADTARHVLVIDPGREGPYDFFSPCLALVEALLVMVLAKMDPKIAGQRIKLCEQFAIGLLGENGPPSQ